MDKYHLTDYEREVLKTIEVDTDKLYYLKHLSLYLKSKGLPFSHPTLIKYEKEGLIKSPRLSIPHRGNEARVYSGREIREIAETLRNHIR